MYLDFYGFREKPFNLTPDPRFVFLSKSHREAFAHLLYGINNRAGFILLTGEVGSGKTTVLRSLLSQLGTDQYRTALIFNPCLSPPELIRNINREFGLSENIPHSSSLLDTLNPFLLQQNAEGRTVVLAIDEAQNMEAPVLEQIRLISNLETDRDKLIQIVLAGQPELVKILERKDLRQLSQRITVRCHLRTMNFEDTAAYIRHRLEVAGKRNGALFSRGALKRIYGYSQGLPRLVNAACDRALLAAYSRDAPRISSKIASVGIKDMRGRFSFPPRKRGLILIPAAVLLAAALVLGIPFGGPDLNHRFNLRRQVEETGRQDPKSSFTTGQELSRALAAELAKIPESESARTAFNSLAGLWKVRHAPGIEDLNRFEGMKSAALGRDLSVYRFSGNLGALLRIDYPAILELTIPGVDGKRFISLVGVENESFIIEPPISGRRVFPPAEIERHWSGQGFLLWKDPLNLSTSITPESKGDPIRQLQTLLREAGVTTPLTGVYDRDTISAVRGFQSSKGIQQDGVVGGQTLMLLYRSIERFGVPRLTGGRS
jgi:general secretion pathway protein A